MNRLQGLVQEALAETGAQRELVPVAEMERLAASAPKVRDFPAALRAPGLSVIAEMKARSPSAGTLALEYAPGQLARTYAEGGAVALSVLAQKTSFGGSPQHLREARQASCLPVMRKDFVTDEYQVLEARAVGADAVLLIVAALSGDRLARLLGLVRDLGMEALVEVHSAEELQAALAAGSVAVGINHRDLTTLEVDLDLSRRLRPLVPAGTILVAESGIRTGEDSRRLHDLGFDAILVGEALMRSPDPAALIRELALG